MPATCGAAAEVPLNGFNPVGWGGCPSLAGSVVFTFVAAARSGLSTSRPPLVPASSLPGVIGLSSGL